MSEEEQAPEVVPEGQASDKRYVTATFSKTDDQEILSKYDMIRKIASMSANDIVSMGIAQAWNSPEFKKAAKLLSVAAGKV